MKWGVKRAVGIVIVAAVIWGVMTVFSDRQGVHTNKAFKEDKMVTLNGSDFKDGEDEYTFADKGLGFGITYTGTYGKMHTENRLNEIVMYPYCVALQYSSGKANEIECSVINPGNISDEDILVYSELLGHEKSMVAGVFRLPGDASAATAKSFETFNGWFVNVSELCSFNGDTYYIGYNKDFSKMTLDDAEKAEVSKLAKEIREFKNGICIFPYEIARSMGNSLGDLSNFSTTTLSGETITQDVLKDYDLTMVNVWATWCGACVEELPELARLYSELPENVNMLTICVDCDEESDLAKEIYQDSNGNFPVLFASDDIKNSLTNNIQTLPTTIFVDKEGKIVGNPIIGAPRGDVSEFYMNAINEALRSV